MNTLGDDDVFHVRQPGSGGYGDPLERDAERVAEDVAEGKITPETAREVYCVPVDDDGTITGSVADAREQRYRDRLAAASTPEETPTPGETESTTYRLGATVGVEIDEDGRPYATCDRCGTHVGRADEDWKATAAVREESLATVGAATNDAAGYCLRRFCCPDCGTLLDTEVAKRGDRSLVSRLSV